MHRKLNSEVLYVSWASFDQGKKLGVLIGMVKLFTRLCFPCYHEIFELKTLYNTFLSLGYPGNLVSKVIKMQEVQQH